MGKLRYVAPGVIAAASVVAGATPALASTPKNDNCTPALCLYFSAGRGSGIFRTNATEIKNLEFFDFVSGAGAGTIVRNNAHSFNTLFSVKLFSKVSLTGVERTLPTNTPFGTSKASPLPLAERNNESSFLRI